MTTTEKSRRGGRKAANPLTDQQELDLIKTYVTTDASIKVLGRTYAIADTYIYRILTRHGVTWRRDFTETFLEWAHETGRYDLIDALKLEVDAGLVAPTAPVSLDLDRLNADTGFATPGAASDKPVPDLPLELQGPSVEWQVTITENIAVSAQSIEGAIDEAKRLRRGGRITAVRLRDMGGA